MVWLLSVQLVDYMSLGLADALLGWHFRKWLLWPVIRGENALSASVCCFLSISVFSLLHFCCPLVMTFPLSSHCLSAFTHLCFAVLLSLLCFSSISWPLASCTLSALVWSKYSVTCEYWMCSLKHLIRCLMPFWDGRCIAVVWSQAL